MVPRRLLLAPLVFALAAGSAPSRADLREYADPTRPVCLLGRDRATLQWFTRLPEETRLQIRPGTVPCNTPGPDGKPRGPWASADVRAVNGAPGKRTFHVLVVTGLRPGARYSYRLYDPGVEPTSLERTWGAEAPWRREYSFSTLAGAGRKTVVRVPIKVLLMPNVVNVASAHDANGPLAPPPPDLAAADLERIRAEYARSALFLWVNNGMRVWFDYRIVVDGRRQRWGPEPANAGVAYRGWPECRGYGGADFVGPGGGDFTFVDARRPEQTHREPVFEAEPYVGQIEQAFVRRWNPAKKAWEFYNSGGGTLGVDDWAKGVPGRSQYLGGGDTAWLATHEYHHQIESLGAFSLANREDDRVIFDHFFPRRRLKKADGTWDEWTWNTSWRHGEHWDGIAYFDRMLTPAQWLRLHFGETITVIDADEDGVPDDDPRLPLDERRFGSNARRPKTDGQTPDLDKIQLSTWAPTPLTSSWDKAPLPRIMPDPKRADSDRDGLSDTLDPYPLYPWQPFIWPMTARVDGDPAEWAALLPSGHTEGHGVAATLWQAHDDAAYYACFRLTGPWRRASVGLDGEGQGYYTTDSTYAFDIVAGESGAAPDVRPSGPHGCPGMEWKTSVAPDGAGIVEVMVPNRGKGTWFWTGGGREVGAAVSLWTRDGKPLSLYEPHDLFYARMLERAGRAELPTGAPAELKPGPGVRTFDFTLAPPDGAWTLVPGNWEQSDGALRFVKGDESDNYLYLGGFDSGDFDVWIEFEAASDMHIGAWTAGGRPTDNVTDYVAFLGGFGNARSVIRVDGAETGAEDLGIPPGRHTMQFSRDGGSLWLLCDGKPVAWARDPEPERRVGRIGFLGGWGGRQVIYQARIRAKRSAP